MNETGEQINAYYEQFRSSKTATNDTQVFLDSNIINTFLNENADLSAREIVALVLAHRVVENACPDHEGNLWLLSI